MFDEHLTCSDQISSVSKSCYYQICQLRCIRPYTSIPRQLPPSQLPLFTPSLTIATLFITTCPSHITRLEQIQNTLRSYCIDGCLLAWLRNFLLLPYLFHPRWKSCEVELFSRAFQFAIRIDSFCKKIGLSIH